MELDISSWVDTPNTEQKEFRRAVHTILVAIAMSDNLRTKMIIKGGMLLAIEFRSTRFTKDIDFSTSEKASSFDVEGFLVEFRESLNYAVNSLSYGLDCRLQSHEMKPARPDATFPTLKLKIGHAYKGDRKHRLLIQEKCPSIVEIDYSFNELNSEIDTLFFDENHKIKAYSLVDIVAEKYRAIIQQKFRDRRRRQDPYDLYFLFKNGHLASEDLKKKILDSLLVKSESRKLVVDRDSLGDSEIIKRSMDDYGTLADEIEGELPHFDEVYGVVREYYEGLPW